MAEGWKPSSDVLWMFVAQGLVALFFGGVLYTRFLVVEAEASAASASIERAHDSILTLQIQYIDIVQKLDDISADVKALHDKP